MKRTILIIASILTGCSSSEIISTWKNHEVIQKKFDPIMIVGIMPTLDSGLCLKMEQQFVTRLKELGYNAFSSIAVYGSHAYDNIQEEETFKLIYDRNIAAVLTIELVEKQEEVLPAPLWLDNYYYRYEFPFQQQEINVFKHSFIQTSYIWESNYYDMNGFLMIYSVKSKSYGPFTKNKLAAEYGNMIIGNMMKNGMLRKQVTALKPF